MGSKNFTDVLIGGKVYTLGGLEEESYLQQVASYINEKLSILRRQDGFIKQSEDYQTVMAYLNLADDYFKEREHAESLAAQKAGLEKENYSLKHELVSTQLKLEAALRETEGFKHALKESEAKLMQAEKKRRQLEAAEQKAAEEKAKSEAEAASAARGSQDGGADSQSELLKEKQAMDKEITSLQGQLLAVKTELERYKAFEAARAHMGEESIPALGRAGEGYLGALHRTEKTDKS